jgi:hypothetical protein
MFQGCKLGLRDHDPERVAAVRTLSTDPLISRVPQDWALGRAWDSDILENDILGDCGPAGAVNWLKLMLIAQGRDKVLISSDDAEEAYRALGWDGTPATDNGVVLLDLMEYWTREPIGGFQLDCFFRVGFGDASHLATALGFAPLIVGASLTEACMTRDTWDADAAAGPTKGGHCYLYLSDSPGGGNGKSWGQTVWTTPPFRAERWRECYLPICRELMPMGDAEFLRLMDVAGKL